MKSTSKKRVYILVFNLVLVALFALPSQSFSQTKHKGLPWPAPDEFVKMKNPVSLGETTIEDGKELYNQQCKSCHGVKGKGDGPKAEKIDILSGDFTSAEFTKASDGEMYWKTTEGRKPMPSYKEKLTDKERWTIIHYIRTFAKSK